MTRSQRIFFRALLIGVFSIAGVAIAVSPTRYRVDLDTIGELWGDIFRDLDAVVRTVRISTGLEIEYGNEIAQRYWQASGSATDEAYVAAVGAQVATQARRQDIPWTFHVVPASYPNAWAILGGHVYITTTMLDLIDSEAELAAVLAHEIAHVDMMHCVDIAQNRLLLEHVGMDALAYLLSFAEDLAHLGFSEVQESEADRYAMLMAARAGYSPLNAFDTFREFYLAEEYAPSLDRPDGGPEVEILGSVGELLSDYLQTHPPFASRLDYLRALLETNARGWEGRSFRVGQRAYSNRTFEPDTAEFEETWIFSVEDPQYLALRTELAFLLHRQEEAEHYLNLLAQRAPEHDRIEHLEALLSGETQPERRDVATSSDPVRVVPDPEGERPAASDDQAIEAHYQRGVSLRLERQYREAVEQFDAALALAGYDKSNPEQSLPTHRLTRFIFYERGRALTAMTRYQDAMESFSSAISVDPNFYRAHQRLAWAAFQSGDYSRAEASFETAFALSPSYGMTLNNFAWFLATVPLAEYRDPVRAIGLASAAVRDNPSVARLDTLATAYLAAGESDHAVEVYLGILEEDSSFRTRYIMASGLRFMECTEEPVRPTQESIEQAIRQCAGEHVVSFSAFRENILRIEKLSADDPVIATQSLRALAELEPNHSEVIRLLAESESW